MRHTLSRGHALLVTLLLGLACQPASASFDFGCRNEWKLDAEQQGLCNNWPFLSPANDSRINIRLLLDVLGAAPLTAHPGEASDDVLAARVPFDLSTLHAAETETPPTGDPAAELALLLEPLGLGSTEFAPQVFARDEGTRCRSNDLSNATAFIAAMAQSDVPTDARRRLAHLRLSLLTTCGPSAAPLQVPQALRASPVGAAFADYLLAAEAFYAGDLQRAEAGFALLHAAEQPWLRETSRYLSGRVLLNQVMAAAIDDYGYLEREQVDSAAADAAIATLQHYLTDYPAGRYAASARGLLRKLYWLKGDRAALAAEFAWQWKQPAAQRHRSLQQLIDEFDGKLLFDTSLEQAQDPLLLATLDLMALRKPWDQRERLSAAELQQQQTLFSAQPRLFGYLQAAQLLYAAQAPQAALDSLPPLPAEGPLDTLAFSEQSLRGLALERLGEQAQARAHWRALLPLTRDALQREQVQLALALNLERGGLLEEVFASDSPIDSAPIRLQLLRYLAGPELLRSQLQQSQGPAREALLYALLYKDLLRGHYAAFVRDSAALGQPASDSPLAVFRWNGDTRGAYACPDLQQLAARLAADPQQAHALLCLGDWVRTLDLRYSPLAQRPPADELGGTAELFPGTPFSRLQAYQAVIGNPQAAAEDRAYALYRAVYCFAPGGNNDCDTQDIDPAQRKAWFHQLKREYPHSHWAESLRYYW